MLSRLYTMPERNGQTDRFAISILRVSVLTPDEITNLSSNIKKTTVGLSQTIRKPPLVEAQTYVRKPKNKIGRKTMFNMADGILTRCNATCGFDIMTVNSPIGSRPTMQRDTSLWDDVIDFARWQHPAIWHVKSWQWIRPVAAPCNVVGGSRMSGHEFAQTLDILQFYICFWSWPYHAVDMSFCTSQRNFIQVGSPSAGKNNVTSIVNMAYLRHVGL